MNFFWIFFNSKSKTKTNKQTNKNSKIKQKQKHLPQSNQMIQRRNCDNCRVWRNLHRSHTVGRTAGGFGCAESVSARARRPVPQLCGPIARARGNERTIWSPAECRRKVRLFLPNAKVFFCQNTNETHTKRQNRCRECGQQSWQQLGVQQARSFFSEIKKTRKLKIEEYQLS